MLTDALHWRLTYLQTQRHSSTRTYLLTLMDADVLALDALVDADVLLALTDALVQGGRSLTDERRR